MVLSFDNEEGMEMQKEMSRIRCMIARGGTSKGIFILENDLPKDAKKRDDMILAIFGSPDQRQIDGLGGADPLTSKLAIIGPSTHPDADIDYTFGQVSMVDRFIDYKGNCGNISAAVGPVAIALGLVKVTEPMTTIAIHMTNSHAILRADIPIVDGQAAVEGDEHIAGCPGTGARIALDWSGTQGSISGALLPTGNVRDRIVIDGTEYEVSLVDAGNPLVFIEAKSLGLRGTETPAMIEADQKLMERIEYIRSIAAVKFGLVKESEEATAKSPYNPFFCIVSAAQNYVTYEGAHVRAVDIDITSRLLFMQRMHKTHPGTGTVCLGAAARIPGTIVHTILKPEAHDRLTIHIGHPAGVIPVEAEASNENGQITLARAAIYRTARLLMEGYAFVKNSVL